jgi:hypothetical protein
VHTHIASFHHWADIDPSMVNLFLVRVDYHGEPLPDEQPLLLHPGDNTFGSSESNEHVPSSGKVQWGKKQAIIRVSTDRNGIDQIEIEDKGTTGLTYVGRSVDIESMTQVIKSTKPLEIGDFIWLGKKSTEFDRFQLLKKLPASVKFDELNTIPAIAPSAVPASAAVDPMSKPVGGNDTLGSQPHAEHAQQGSLFDPMDGSNSSFQNMNISINYPTNNPNPVNIRIEGSSPTKQQQQTSSHTSGSIFDRPINSSSAVPGHAYKDGDRDDESSKLRKSLTFSDEVSKAGHDTAQSKLPAVEAPKKSALKTTSRQDDHLASSSSQSDTLPGLGVISAKPGALIADELKAADQVVSRIAGPISVFPAFDADSIPDYVMMEAVAESVLSSRDTSTTQLQLTIAELKELSKQSRSGAAIDTSLSHNKVSGEFDAIFRDLVVAILTNGVNCLENLSRNNLFMSLKLADNEKYDIGVYKILLTNKDRLVELLAYYQQQTKAGGPNDHQIFEILTRCIGPITTDLEKIKAVLDFINKQIDDSSRTKKTLSRSALGSQISELRSLKGKQKLLRRVMSYMDSALTRQNLKAFNKWKLLLRSSQRASRKQSCAMKYVFCNIILMRN